MKKTILTLVSLISICSMTQAAVGIAGAAEGLKVGDINTVSDGLPLKKAGFTNNNTRIALINWDWSAVDTPGDNVISAATLNLTIKENPENFTVYVWGIAASVPWSAGEDFSTFTTAAGFNDTNWGTETASATLLATQDFNAGGSANTLFSVSGPELINWMNRGDTEGTIMVTIDANLNTMLRADKHHYCPTLVYTTDIPESGTYALLAGLTGLVYVMVRRRK